MPSRRSNLEAACRQAGVVLLEALVAILIFSFGILGLVGLQAASIKNLTESQFRVEAANWANTLLAQIRTADPATRLPDFQTNGGSETNGYLAWYKRLTDATTGLPGAGLSTNRPTVVFGGPDNSIVTVTLLWQAKTDSVTRQHVVTTQLD